MRRLVFQLLALALVIMSCATARPPPSIAPGRPPFGPGAPEAYWIWHNQGGWHLRTTTAGLAHRFHGAVVPLGGNIVDVRASRLEWQDRIPGGRAGDSVRLRDSGWRRRLDWHVTSGCNRFEIFIDGVARPGLVHLGGPAHQPRHVPFDRCR